MRPLLDVLARIDAANDCDPSAEMTASGPVAAARLYSERMSEVLAAFEPHACDALRIAARGQHIERWTRPRSDYPEGRDGYLSWRREAAHFHVARVTALMRESGCSSEECDRVGVLMLKQNLKADPDTQTLEDVACLVFFRWYAGDFSAKHDPEKIRTVVTRTARKMSPKGRAAALSLGLPQHVADAIQRAT